jgi:hypothetical protein
MKISRFIAKALAKGIQDLMLLNQQQGSFEILLPRNNGELLLENVLKALTEDETIWILSESLRHPNLEALPATAISDWVKNNFGSGEHGLIISPISGAIFFVASYKEEDLGGYEVFVSCKRGNSGLVETISSLFSMRRGA